MAAHYPILLLDDDANLVEILSRAAVSSFPQAQFIPVISYDQAVTYLDGLRGVGPRLILLDIHLQTPQSGLDFLSRLRQHPQGRLTPAVVFSSSLSQTDIERSYQLGANVVTEKPASYQGWKDYLHQLYTYWFSIVTLPNLWFGTNLDTVDD